MFALSVSPRLYCRCFAFIITELRDTRKADCKTPARFAKKPTWYFYETAVT